MGSPGKSLGGLEFGGGAGAVLEVGAVFHCTGRIFSATYRNGLWSGGGGIRIDGIVLKHA